MFLGDESGYQADRSLYTLGVMIDIQTYNQRGNYEYRQACRAFGHAYYLGNGDDHVEKIEQSWHLRPNDSQFFIILF